MIHLLGPCDEETPLPSTHFGAGQMTLDWARGQESMSQHLINASCHCYIPGSAPACSLAGYPGTHNEHWVHELVVGIRDRWLDSDTQRVQASTHCRKERSLSGRVLTEMVRNSCAHSDHWLTKTTLSLLRRRPWRKHVND